MRREERSSFYSMRSSVYLCEEGVGFEFPILFIIMPQRNRGGVDRWEYREGQGYTIK